MNGRPIAKAGVRYTSQEMFRHDAPAGYSWWNEAKVGEPQRWIIRIAPHESRLLFGYEPEELMAKQYAVVR